MTAIPVLIIEQSAQAILTTEQIIESLALHGLTDVVTGVQSQMKLGEDKIKAARRIGTEVRAVILRGNHDWQQWLQDNTVEMTAIIAATRAQIPVFAIIDTRADVIEVQAEQLDALARVNVYALDEIELTFVLSDIGNALRINQRDIMPDVQVDTEVASAGQRNDIFISYSRKDDKTTRRVKDYLSSQGFEVWIDWEDIPAEADWMAEIHAGIDSAHTFLFFMSKLSLSSFVCHMEIAYARAKGKRIIPVVLENPDSQDTYPQQALTQLMKKPLTAAEEAQLGDLDLGKTIHTNYWQAIKPKNWVFFHDLESDADFDSRCGRLLTAIQTDLSYLQQYHALQRRALEWQSRGLDQSRLLNARELTEATTWLEDAIAGDKQPSPTRIQQDFISASRVQLRHQRTVFGASSLMITIVLIVIAVFAFQQTMNSRMSQRENASLDMVNLAQSEQRSNDPLFAMSLLMEANSWSGSPQEAQIALAELAFEPGIRRVFAPLRDGWVFAFSSDGTQLFTGAPDKGILIWDWRTREQIGLLAFETPYNQSPEMIVPSQDNRELYVYLSRELQIYSLDDFSLQQSITLGYTPDDVALSPDGAYLAHADARGNVILFETETMTETLRMPLFSDVSSSPSEVEFTQDQRYLVATGRSFDVVVYDIREEIPVARHQFDKRIERVVIGADSQTVYSATDNGIVKFDLLTGEILDEFATGNDYDFIAFMEDEQYVVAMGQFSNNGAVDVYSTTGQYPLYRQITPAIAARTMAVTPDEQHVVLGYNDDVQLWDIHPGNQTPLFSYSTSRGAAVDIALSPNKSTVALAVDTDAVLIWNGEDVASMTNFDDDLLAVEFLDNDTVIGVSQEEDTENISIIIAGISMDDIIDMVIRDRGDFERVRVSSHGDNFAILTEDETIIFDRQGNELASTPIRSVEAVFSETNPEIVYIYRPGLSRLYEWAYMAEELPDGTYVANVDRDPSHLSFNADRTQVLEVSTFGFASVNEVNRNRSLRLSTDGGVSDIVFSQDEAGWLMWSANDLRAMSLDPVRRPYTIAFDTPIAAAHLESATNTAYVVTEDGRVTAWDMYPSVNLIMAWVRENRAYDLLSCSQLQSYDVPRSCNRVPVPLDAQHPPTLVPLPTLTPIDFDNRPTSTPRIEPTERSISDIEADIVLAGIGSDVRLPRFEALRPDLTTFGRSEDYYEEEWLQNMFAPGDFYYHVFYDDPDGDNMGVVALSDNPYDSYDDWLGDLSFASWGVEIRTTERGLSYAAVSESVFQSSTRVQFMYMDDDVFISFFLDPTRVTDGVISEMIDNIYANR